MVAISHKELRHIRECLLEVLGVFRVAQPDGVEDSFVTLHLAVLVALANLEHPLGDIVVTLVSEKNGLSIGLLRVDQFCSIFLLFLKGELVLLDPVLLVVDDAGQPEDAMLDMVAHLHAVDVHPLLGILAKIPVAYEILQRVFTFFINLTVVWLTLTVNFWFDHIEVTQGSCLFLGLLGGESVVWRADDLGG